MFLLFQSFVELFNATDALQSPKKVFFKSALETKFEVSHVLQNSNSNSSNNDQISFFVYFYNNRIVEKKNQITYFLSPSLPNNLLSMCKQLTICCPWKNCPSTFLFASHYFLASRISSTNQKVLCKITSCCQIDLSSIFVTQYFYLFCYLIAPHWLLNRIFIVPSFHSTSADLFPCCLASYL